MGWWLPALLALPTLWLFILLLYAGPARAAWREPVLRHPVLIIESDDWGPGPPAHAQSLARVAACLNAHRDATGMPAVMTLGLTLSLPDGEAIASSGFHTYHARPILDPAYADLLAAIQEGIRLGVYAPQLHGMAHYWPDALLVAARRDPAIREWVLAGPGQETEALPSPLQTRWADASVLPSRPLADAAIAVAVAEEVDLYRTAFGERPQVVVPPTFIWTWPVEAAWAAHGAKALVTPGHRCTGRDAQGQPDCEAVDLYNGQQGIGGIVYLVRDRYFEPDRGHRAEDGLKALAEKCAQGRPCLLETHRFNFTGSGQELALAELDRLLGQALQRFPGLRFMSAAELAQHYRKREPAWIASNLGTRLAAWNQRMARIPRFAKLARWSGLGGVLALLAPTKGVAA
ncbi:MAG: hypothetical protein H6935_08235 [Thiobacillus sp.]|nr:hypothetical protein [Thiobacillus sp.]